MGQGGNQINGFSLRSFGRSPPRSTCQQQSIAPSAFCSNCLGPQRIGKPAQCHNRTPPNAAPGPEPNAVPAWARELQGHPGTDSSILQQPRSVRPAISTKHLPTRHRGTARCQRCSPFPRSGASPNSRLPCVMRLPLRTVMSSLPGCSDALSRLNCHLHVACADSEPGLFGTQKPSAPMKLADWFLEGSIMTTIDDSLSPVE